MSLPPTASVFKSQTGAACCNSAGNFTCGPAFILREFLSRWLACLVSRHSKRSTVVRLFNCEENCLIKKCDIFLIISYFLQKANLERVRVIHRCYHLMRKVLHTYVIFEVEAWCSRWLCIVFLDSFVFMATCPNFPFIFPVLLPCLHCSNMLW